MDHCAAPLCVMRRAKPCGSLVRVPCSSPKHGVCSVPERDAPLGCVTMASSELSEPPHAMAALEPAACASHGAAHMAYIDRRLTPYMLALARAGANVSQRLRDRLCKPVGHELRVTLSAHNRSSLRLTAVYNAAGLKRRDRADGVLAVLLRALESGGAALLHPHVRALRPPRMELFFTFGDFPPSSGAAGLPAGLPVLSMATSEHASGLAVPDWTFARNHEMNASAMGLLGALGRGLGEHGLDTSWEAVSAPLLRAARAPPAEREPKLLWRGSPGNQPTFHTGLPLEQRTRRSVALAAARRASPALARLGVAVDVASATPDETRRRLSWAEMCRARYQLHLDGFGYSFALRYRLACGSIVLRPRAVGAVARGLNEPHFEWWEAAWPMRPGVEYVPLHANLSDLELEVRRLERSPHEALRVWRAAAAYTQRALPPEAASCFWRHFLIAYTGLHAAWQRTCAGAQPAARAVSWLEANPSHERRAHCFPRGYDPCYASAAELPPHAANVTAVVEPLRYDFPATR